MDTALFKKSTSGKLVRTTGGYWAFVPGALPPKLEWDDNLVSIMSRADIALGTLSGLGETLPNPHLLIYPFIRREAVLSSRIEGTQSSLSDLLLFEATQVEKRGDVREVQNYVRAMEYGLKRLTELPLSLRFIRELHGILMEGVRGQHATPGEFRQSQNWIGSPGAVLDDATYVPPPVPEMQECLSQLEKFLHAETKLPPLVEAALVHYQFEAIHPFLDGNGRIGRLLVALLLCQRNVLSKPLLYLSAFFEQYRDTYYDLLLNVSSAGGWRQWIEFFLKAVVEQSGDAVSRSRRLQELQHSYIQLAREKRLAPTAAQLVDIVLMKPVISAKTVQESLKVTPQGARKAINVLVEVGILTEVTGRKRDKAYAANEVLKALDGELKPG
ncbi:MAG: cell filamentation protein Fic [Dehalococcoides mccartyi]|uniref:Fic family protein n=1 Tax=Dehalococcoides mccartyi TaxID=61435 RepID=UPI002432641D|nr:Fic family protein [Dehalococcoides mccartyi]MCF7634637.1 cell filamentation protein Fic [Dehalococcoides mccartyi]